MSDAPRLRSVVAGGVALAFAVPAPSARAAETADDVETDHIDAADDGGPRTWGLALSPFEADLGLVGVEVGAALGPRAVFTFEGDWLAVAPTLVYGATLGVAFFPTRFAFHGLYVHPRVEAWRASLAGSGLGAGGVVGYEWTAPVGATLRLGGGLAYVAWSGPASAAPPANLTGLVPEIDAAVGWVF
jgi:hypothetical protein